MTLIPGDGIGPELLNHVRELFRLEDEARYKQTSPENTKYKHLSFNNIHRFCCVPVDFEIVRVDSSALRMTSIMRLLRSNVME